MDDASPLTPFELTPKGPLPPDWIGWLGRVLGGDAGRPDVGPPPSLEWDDILPALDAHAISPMLYVRLRDAGRLGDLPAGVRSALSRSFQVNALRTMLFDDELARIADALGAQGIPLIPLKGLATGRLVYGSAAERPIGDLDLLIPLEHMAAARRTLRAIGYQGIGWAGLDRLARWQHAYRSELPLLCTQPDRYGLVTELHWSLLEIPYYIARINMGDVWAQATPALGHAGILRPDPATLLIHGAAHMALHHSRELRLIWLVDLDRLARWPRLDWQAVLRQTEAWGLGTAVHHALAAAQGWLGSPVPDEAAQRLAALALDPAGVATWGLGDERAGRAQRRAAVSWQLFDGRQRLRYASWVGLRALLRPLEYSSRPPVRMPEAAAPEKKTDGR
jgi:hypothetical protein